MSELAPQVGNLIRGAKCTQGLKHRYSFCGITGIGVGTGGGGRRRGRREEEGEKRKERRGRREEEGEKRKERRGRREEEGEKRKERRGRRGEEGEKRKEKEEGDSEGAIPNNSDNLKSWRRHSIVQFQKFYLNSLHF